MLPILNTPPYRPAGQCRIVSPVLTDDTYFSTAVQSIDNSAPSSRCNSTQAVSKSNLQITVLLTDDASKCWIQVYFAQRYQSRFGYLQIRQAMLVAIHRHKLLVEGSAPNPLLNPEFHSVAARSSNTLSGYAKTPSPFGQGWNNSFLPLLFLGLL